MRRISLTLGCLVVALACSALIAAAQAPTRDSATGTANAVGGGPSGAVSKKKCTKKKLWKCAPKRYNLFVDGMVRWNTGFESFVGEIHLVRVRAGLAYVLYKVDLGELGVFGSEIAEFSDHLPLCPSDVRVETPGNQLIVVGNQRGLGDPTDFLVRFDLIGPDKNTYGVLAGSTDPRPSTQNPGAVVHTCLADPGYWVDVGGPGTDEGWLFFGSDKLDTQRRGKVGDPILHGGAISGEDTLEWVLTTRDHCPGRFCEDFALDAPERWLSE